MGISFKRLLSITLAATCMVSVVGCSNQGKGKSSMGRYVEERYEVPEGVGVQNLTLLDKDKIGMTGYSMEDGNPVAFISEDGGKTWVENPIELPKEEGKELYGDLQYLSNGRMLLSYYFEEPFTEMEEGVIDDSVAVEGEGGVSSEEEFIYEVPEFTYATVDVDGNLSVIDLVLSIYNDDD